MSITATNRINTEREVEVVISFHRETLRESITMTIYASGMHSTVFMTVNEARDLHDALYRTASEIDENAN
jgi:hypothetical protein